MGRLHDNVVAAVHEDRFVVSTHADERCEERGVTAWQLAVGIGSAELVRARPRSKPSPSVVLRQTLEDGAEVEANWAWLAASRRDMLVTVFFRN